MVVLVRKVAIVGVGQTRCGRRDDVSMPEMIYEAVRACLEDARVSIKDVEAIVTGSMPGLEGVNDPQYYLADGLGVFGKPLIRVATCGSTGGSIFHSAYFHVASGLFDVVMVIGYEKMYESDPQGNIMNASDPFIQRPFLAGAPGAFALQCIQYMHRYNIPYEKLREAAAKISVIKHENALDNPYAHIRVKITEEDVIKSRMISFPIRLLDCCPSSDGACAVLLASEEAAKKITDTPAWVKGVGYAGDEQWFGDKDLVEWMPPYFASQRAYKMAGIENPRKQLDVVELYDPFTWQDFMWYERFGFCGKGEAADMVMEGVTTRDGDLPISPSGGVLCTHPIGATGLQRVAEAALQVMGKADKRQVSGAETAFASAMGGIVQFTAVTIVSVNP